MLSGSSAEHEPEPGRLGPDAQHDQVGPVLLDHLEHLVDVARPLVGRAVAVGLRDVAREDVVEDDRGGPVGVALDVDEVAQRELGQVHAVDEREADAAALERQQRLGALEEVVARDREQLRAAAAVRP